MTTNATDTAVQIALNTVKIALDCATNDASREKEAAQRKNDEWLTAYHKGRVDAFFAVSTDLLNLKFVKGE